MDELLKYFPDLTTVQRQQFNALEPLYREWNDKINVISRRDIGSLYEHHVLHSLAIAKAVEFTDGCRVLDFGTGGGFPGIPLAIMLPQCSFKLIDATGKKIRVASEVVKSIGLQNVTAEHIRGEELKEQFDIIVSRAVMPLAKLASIVRKNLQKGGRIVCLKGGDLKEELRPFDGKVVVTPVDRYFKEEWFKEKFIVEISIS